jgi:peroxiredoxin
MTPSGTIADQVATMRAGRPSRAEGEAPDPFEVEQEKLAADGPPTGVVAVGSILEDAQLLDIEGKEISLYAAIGDQTAVVVLYRGEWCPYCSIALRSYQSELVPALEKFGARLVALSPQRPDGSLSTKEKFELTFTVLSDPGNQIAAQLGVITAPSADALAMQRHYGLDLSARNADGTTGLPMPTTVIVDTDHVVRWIDVHPDYSTRSEPAEIIEALEAL